MTQEKTREDKGWGKTSYKERIKKKMKSDGERNKTNITSKYILNTKEKIRKGERG